MNKAQSQTGILKGLQEAKLFWLLAFITAAALALYLSFIARTIFSLVEDKQLAIENRSLSAEISELELSTLALNDSVSIEKAYAMGFVSAPRAEYVSRGDLLSKR